jgi:cellulose synthase (UDP-forming)
MNSDSKTLPASPQEPTRKRRYHDQILTQHARRNFLAFLITVTCALAYLVWITFHIDYNYWYIAFPYIFAEVISLISMLLWSEMMMRRREHAPSGLALENPPPPVDVIVTCCGEPFSIVEKTLRAATAIDYPDFSVTVADDRHNIDVERLCTELGVKYLLRPTHENRKAGNLNYALRHTSNLFLLVLDADQLAHRGILKVLMGYFVVAKIGFVTTYQAFDVPEGDPWSNRDRVFYGAMQTSRNASNSSISCGSGVVYRRQALNQIGGFATWSLVEDLYSSLLLHAAGWKSVYHPYPATHGTAPAEITGHVRQRWQWAVDSLRLLFWRNPLFTKGLSWEQKLNYIGFGYNYLLFGLAYPIFYLLPIWGLFSGCFFLKTTALAFLLWRMPYAVSFYIFNRFSTEWRHSSKSFRAQAVLFEVYISAIITALLSRRHLPHYFVTKKVSEIPMLIERLNHVLPHIAIMSLSLTGIVYGFFHRSENQVFYYINAGWALWVVWILLPFTILALRDPTEKTQS